MPNSLKHFYDLFLRNEENLLYAKLYFVDSMEANNCRLENSTRQEICELTKVTSIALQNIWLKTSMLENSRLDLRLLPYVKRNNSYCR